jgi:membrane-bound lytic murein transglycosylase B
MHKYLICLVLLLPTALQAVDLNRGDYRGRSDVAAFIAEVAAETDYREAELVDLFSRVNHQRHLFERMDKPAEKLKWHQYRRIFLTDKRTDAGVRFWNEHKTLLQQVEQAYQVPPEIIVAIVGVETFYGTYKGKAPVFDTLVTFAFDYPKRAKFFRRELKEFLILSRENQLDTRAIMGSYAGAMGMPQFISSSYRAYAVDFDGDGSVNLFDSLPDILGSVANYFKRHGWQPGGPVAARITATDATAAANAETSMKPEQDWQALRKVGFSSGQPIDDTLPVALLRLEQKEGLEYWAGFDNFYVITRYNHSPLYAMAVLQLSEAIKRKAGL